MLRVTRLLLICGLLFLVFGSSGTVASAQGLQSPPAQTASTTYVVQAGDNLTKIGAKYGITWNAIYEANRDIISDPDMIHPGQELKIPG